MKTVLGGFPVDKQIGTRFIISKVFVFLAHGEYSAVVMVNFIIYLNINSFEISTFYIVNFDEFFQTLKHLTLNPHKKMFIVDFRYA